MSDSSPEPKPRDLDSESVREFGGAKGVVAIMIASHAVLYYLWIAWRFNDGAVPHPSGLGDLIPFLGHMGREVVVFAAPTAHAAKLYFGFLAMQALFAVTLPGIRMRGLPIRHEGGRQLEYVCNGTWAWYLTLIVVAVLHFSGMLKLTVIGNEFGPLMTVAILAGDAITLATYAGAFVTRNTHRMSGSHAYDFFMGAWLNPRLGRLDLKMWAEIRVAWIGLFLLTLAAAASQYQWFGHVSTPMLFMVLAHGLYANACMKGEECIPTTWDIFYEKWGWMLIFWNFAGVPFVYCFSSWYIATHPPFEHSWPYTLLCFALLIGSYYVWDTAQSQRNRFRMQRRGTFVKRRAFPQLPWGTLENPRYLETASGSELLVDGWWRHARKIHYTADIGMALSWGLITGFRNFLPYFYVTFFVIMIAHRARRDVLRCRKKYGADWDRYTREVPWLFVPFVL